jgi:Xaa-Pro aminopeptidase
LTRTKYTDSQSLESFRPLIAGVISAPQAEDTEAWLTLVPARQRPTMKRRLLTFEAQMRSDQAKQQASTIAAAERLALVRSELVRQGLTGFVVPSPDEQQCEYTPVYAKRLGWLTGFTGSAGTAVLSLDQAAMFVDGRYTLQAATQTGELFEQQHITHNPPKQWIAAKLKPGTILGYDPWLHTAVDVAALRMAVVKAGGKLVACTRNPIDAVWKDQPATPIAPIVPQALKYAGKKASEKIAAIGKRLSDERIFALIVTDADSVAWLLNIRGGDVAHSPLPLGFAIVYSDCHVDLFCDQRKISPRLAKHLGRNVYTYPRETFSETLDWLAETRVQIDRTTAAAYIVDRLTAVCADIVWATDPCKLPKAVKNKVELAGAMNAHRRDGVALTRFLGWVKKAAAQGTLTELEVAAQLHAFRRQGELFRDLSFTTIVGAGAHGAIVHYQATPESNCRIEPDSLLLVDSGAQYLDGTTDVTRTVAIGTPTVEMRDRFTRVLKGHIALANTRFPAGTTGHELDVLARHALWQVGLDYDHGTGHGVGSYLGVHEGPHGIGKKPSVPLLPGMIVSNEPGYYKKGEYGIRIENLVFVREINIPGAERPMLGFETLTVAPIDLDLVDVSLLNGAEIDWLNSYHDHVLHSLSPLLEGETAEWLCKATRHIS